jgi:diadenosine tetraphosphatase ApaH/serine/threonine PP2A family protein phosphatase
VLRLAAISDVHSNLVALEAVLADIRKRKVRRRVFVGDAVGYGPEPDRVTEIIKKECRTGAVAGNHDWGVLGLTDVNYFNSLARAAIEWTGRTITKQTRATLEGWPLVKVLKKDDVLLVHSTPVEPADWDYLFSAPQAARFFDSFTQRICLVGHSHVPFIAELTPGGEVVDRGKEAELREGCRYIINVGSVGQPRDQDPRAAYALFDEGMVRIVRVKYDIEATQRRMAEVDLPAPLAERLSLGM